MKPSCVATPRQATLTTIHFVNHPSSDDHRRSRTPNMTLTCLTCKKKGFRTLDEMQYHAEEHHSWCIVCKTTFTDAEQVEAHRRELPYTCTFCFRCFSSQVGLEDHLKTSKVHLVKEKGLLEPKSNEWGAGPHFGCNICSDQYQQLHQLQHHRRQQHEEFFGTPTWAVSRSKTTTLSGPSPTNASVSVGTNATSPKPSQKDDPTARREAFEYVDMVKVSTPLLQTSNRPLTLSPPRVEAMFRSTTHVQSIPRRRRPAQTGQRQRIQSDQQYLRNVLRSASPVEWVQHVSTDGLPDRVPTVRTGGRLRERG